MVAGQQYSSPGHSARDLQATPFGAATKQCSPTGQQYVLLLRQSLTHAAFLYMHMAIMASQCVPSVQGEPSAGHGCDADEQDVCVRKMLGARAQSLSQ